MSAIRSSLPVLGLLAALLPHTPAGAQSSAAAREIEAARERVRALRREAEQLQQRIREAERRREQEQGRETEEILAGLRQGMAALRALGAADALEQLTRIAGQVEERIARGAHDRQELSEEAIEVMRLAVRSLADADRIDAAELLERAIAAGDRARQARTERELDEIRAATPSRSSQIEALLLAERVLRERDRMDAAEMVGRFARSLVGQTGPGETDPEIAAARRQLDVMRMGLGALSEANREDAADILEQAIHVRELALDGQPYQGERPSRGAQAEVMMLAAEILADRGRSDRARPVAEYARELAGQARRLRDAPRSEPATRVSDDVDRIQHLESRIEELAGALRELRAAVEQLRRDRDRD